MSTPASILRFQLQIRIINVLITFCDHFRIYAKDPSHQHKPRHKVPAGYKTEQFLLRVTTIEETSVHGNLQYLEIYHTQLKRSFEEMSGLAIPTLTTNWQKYLGNTSCASRLFRTSLNNLAVLTYSSLSSVECMAMRMWIWCYPKEIRWKHFT